MDIQLTPQQLAAMDFQGGELPRMIDPRNNATYVLVTEAEYAAVQEVLEDERHQRIIRGVALRNAVGRMDESP